MTSRPRRYSEARTARRHFASSVSDARRQNRHSDYFQRAGFEIGLDPDPDRHKYKTGLPTAPRLHLQQRSCTVALDYPTNTNPHRRPLLLHHLPREGRNSRHGNCVTSQRRFESPRESPVTPQRLGEAYGDSVVHRELPPNSIIQQLRNEFLPRNEPADRFRPISNDSNSSESHEPMRIHEPPSRFNSKRHTHARHDMSEDEGKGSSVEGMDTHTNAHYHPSAIVTEVAYEDIHLSPHQTNFRYSRNVTSDPRIETERGFSHDEFPASSHRRQWSHQEMLV